METSQLDAEELRSPENKGFVDYLCQEIDDFLKNFNDTNTVMLFPPFNSYKRLLTHHIVELDYAKSGLSTFSIGEEPRRRTVVCFGSLRRHVLSDDNDKGDRQSSKTTKSDDRATLSKTIVRVDVEKPVDRARKVRKTINYYVPPHMRKFQTEERANEECHPEEAAAEPRSSVAAKISSDDAEMSAPVVDIVTADGSIWDPVFCGKGSCTIPNLVIPILDPSEMSDLSKEIGSVRIVEVAGPATDTTESEYNNTTMVEIYDLPEDVKTQQLAEIFINFVSRGFRLRWIDSNHVLGIFSSPTTAEEFLSNEFPLVKIRPISEGTTLSKEVARHVVLPSSFRPKTCSSLARRLLSGALGLKMSPSAEERAAQRDRLRRNTPA